MIPFHAIGANTADVSFENNPEEGKSSWALIEVPLNKGEYSYWLNPGEGGYAPSLTWDIPEGLVVEDVIWETPKPFIKLGQISYGYSKRMRALVKLSVKKGWKASQSIKGSLAIDYLVCDDEACIPEQGKNEFFLSSLEKTQKDQRRIQEKFESIRKRIPLENKQLQAVIDRDMLVLRMPGIEHVSKAWVIPYKQGIINPKDTVQITSEDGLQFSIPLSQAVEAPIEGILLVEGKGRTKAWKITEGSFLNKIQSETESISNSMGLIMALGLAFVGGLLLNIMPCVLPVLSLKILSFVELSKKENKRVFRYGILFTLGVLVSFWILGFLLLFLRAYGAEIGWGFQLQQPLFVVVLLLLFFLMGLSLFGLFEWGNSFIKLGKYQKLSKGGGVFLSGMFATLVATPCTGPLLGPALGLALTLNPPTSLALLSMIGLGLASPYLAFTAFPSLMRFLPRPGAWLITFKQFLGFLMMATVIWFIWVLQDQIASSFLLLQILRALLVISFGAWIYGKSQLVKKKLFKGILGLTFVVIGIFLAIDGVRGDEDQRAHWGEYHYSKIERALDNGRPVFVDFTAKWCLICQANKVVLDSESVQNSFKKHNVLALRADWTKKDPEITKALQKFGRSGVPLYVLYRKGHTPKIFSQLLSQGNIINELELEDVR